MGTQRQFDVLDIISVLSFIVGLENLGENRQQSAQNDVNAANDKQSHYLLDELSKKFDELNEMLRKLLEVNGIEITAGKEHGKTV